MSVMSITTDGHEGTMGMDQDEPGSRAGTLVDARGRYLHVVRITPIIAPEDEAASSEHYSAPGPVLSSEESEPVTAARGRDATCIVGQIVMHGAIAWVVACTEWDGYDVEVAQVSAGLCDEGGASGGGRRPNPTGGDSTGERATTGARDRADPPVILRCDATAMQRVVGVPRNRVRRGRRPPRDSCLTRSMPTLACRTHRAAARSTVTAMRTSCLVPRLR